MGVLATLDSSGWNYSDYPTTLAYVQNIFTTIYGSDIYLGADSQDGQLAAAFAVAMYDNNQTFASVINSLSPVYAQGTQLSSEVLINGITRQPATNSTATVTLTGAIGTIISGASAKDTNGIIWNITDGVISNTGTIDLFATCSISGAITALPNIINNINTPLFGWSTVNNALAATTGQNAESDYALRLRQQVSVSIPSLTMTDGLLGGLLSIPNVTRAKVYNNPTNTTDINGLLPHSVSAIVEGGDGQIIANQINLRKTIGCYTNGTTSYNVTDGQGIVDIINFSILGYDDLKMAISITALSGYVSTTIALIQNSLISLIYGLEIGEDVLYSRLYTAANLNGSALGLTYNITSLKIGLLSGSLGTSDIAISYNQAARILAINIPITVS